MMRSMAIVASATTLFSAAQASQFVMYTPGGDDTVVERADPIISPDAISGHVHQIFGAVNFAPKLDYDTLQQSECTTVGAADGYGNAADKSSYWHPALFMESSNGTGYVRVPTSGHKLYYRDVGNDKDKKADPFEFPEQFRMVAGDMSMRAAASTVGGQNITQWICHNSGYSMNQGTDGGFPTGVTDCDAYPGFNGAIHFPHCWNGEDFDQANPTAHMSYPDGDVQSGPCPSTHPTRLPHIFLENQFDLHSVVDQVKPDSFVLAQGDATGYGWHADFFNGWDKGAIPELMDSCPQGEYGNADIGTCSSFKPFSTKSSDCKLKTTYDENVNTPGDALPGCNPVTKTNPAPKLAVAALGQATTNCAAGSSSSDSSDDSSDSASSSSASAPASYGSSSAPAYGAPSSTTFATVKSTSATVEAVATGYGNNVVYETVYKTVYGRDAAPTPAYHQHKARHDHAQHVRFHAKHMA